MGVGDARQRDSRAGRAGRPTFDLVTSKLRHPALRAGTVPRSSLIERLASGDPRPVVSVVAPAGYGKTTLLAQWAELGGTAAGVGVRGHDRAGGFGPR
jgi:LuxR family transcriptional regulator, maltose regulon positive regulatory protein